MYIVKRVKSKNRVYSRFWRYFAHGGMGKLPVPEGCAAPLMVERRTATAGRNPRCSASERHVEALFRAFNPIFARRRRRRRACACAVHATIRVLPPHVPPSPLPAPAPPPPLSAPLPSLPAPSWLPSWAATASPLGRHHPHCRRCAHPLSSTLHRPTAATLTDVDAAL